jgi:hypothetical protein
MKSLVDFQGPTGVPCPFREVLESPIAHELVPQLAAGRRDAG